jgi:hypothetical protein
MVNIALFEPCIHFTYYFTHAFIQEILQGSSPLDCTTVTSPSLTGTYAVAVGAQKGLLEE